ncbi:hypothetical protein [Streptomyces sp. XY511]|uniref:hypothetical protein n=1 Tax=Streptomyces sp. XY511 TaxID=1519480 RepID=UPI003B6343CD
MFGGDDANRPTWSIRLSAGTPHDLLAKLTITAADITAEPRPAPQRLPPASRLPVSLSYPGPVSAECGWTRTACKPDSSSDPEHGAGSAPTAGRHVRRGTLRRPPSNLSLVQAEPRAVVRGAAREVLERGSTRVGRFTLQDMFGYIRGPSGSLLGIAVAGTAL